MIRRIFIIARARIREFYRDKTSLGWNFLFPLLIIASFSVFFSADTRNFARVGIVDLPADSAIEESLERFQKSRHLHLLVFDSLEKGRHALERQRVDFLLNPADGRYWVAEGAPGGYVAERFLMAAEHPDPIYFLRTPVAGGSLPYVEWLFPGIIGMNIMFGSLFGVGYAIVRYRKNGVLKRLSVTPLRPWEFLTGQVVSRIFLLLVSTGIVLAICSLLFGFRVKGSIFALFMIFAMGSFALVSLSVIIASRTESEEFAEGVLNLMAWPMMFFSEVWFSLEGADEWVRQVAFFLPLTHVITAARQIMNEGAGIPDVYHHMLALAGLSLIFMVVGAGLFRWHREK
ncbi:ABC transporter permease [Desulfobotulus sp. H1]|uniref:Transport permease protein n=1 Tax=Desulfobotulus pelophilus TaxID=2823377 RepID=A0ABT3N9K3_9BACT|nr:ABC transporter permease [Desulfobotulus pelophilus]MCW7754135.1 ABC transporter permease [Desulfobotulus pelophilus]